MRSSGDQLIGWVMGLVFVVFVMTWALQVLETVWPVLLLHCCRRPRHQVCVSRSMVLIQFQVEYVSNY